MSSARTSRISRVHRARSAWLSLALALTLVGCAVGPDYGVPALDLPQRFARASKTPHPRAELSHWWRGLHDPLLDEIVAEAIAGNLDVAAAKARIREARAVRREAIGGLLPILSGGASEMRSKTSTGSATGNGPVGSVWAAGFDASWELDLFGAERRTVEAAGAGVDAADADLDAVLLTLIGDVARNYVELRGSQARIALARRTAGSQRETAALTAKMFEAGSSSEVDVTKAKALAAATEADIPALEISRAASVHHLGVLTGRDPGALVARLDRARAIPRPHLPLRPGVPADLLSRRPDIARAERQLAQATARIGAADAALYPSVNLTGSLSTSAKKAGDLGRGSTIGWSWGPTLTVPIFQGGRLIAAVDAAEAVRDQSHITFRAAVLTAMEDVENALVALSQDRIRAGRLAEAAHAYGRSAELSRTLWRAGSTTFLDVLDAERSAYSAQDALIQSRVAITTDAIALAKALGGGWDDPIDVLRPEVIDTGTYPHFAVIP